MKTLASGKWEVKHWEEYTCQELERGMKLTRSTVTHEWTGDIEGEGTAEYLMAYREDGTADYSGFHHVVGSVAGRSGSFVLQDIGSFEGSEARGECVVVPGLGTGALKNLKGRGEYVALKGQHHASIAMDYEFD